MTMADPNDSQESRCIDGCQCQDCIARKVGELIMYACRLEQWAILLRNAIDAGAGDTAYEILTSAADYAEARDLSGEVEAAKQARILETSARLRAEGRS